MRKDPLDEIDFRFSRFGGHARGRFAIVVFAGLAAIAIVATVLFWYRATSAGLAYYDRLQLPHARSVASSPSP